MASLSWDRLLGTLHRRGAADLLLTSGSPPMIRMPECWRALQTMTLDAAAVQALAGEMLKDRPPAHTDGYAHVDLLYGDATQFRILAFGYPDTHLLMVSRLPGSDTEQQPQGVPR